MFAKQLQNVTFSLIRSAVHLCVHIFKSGSFTKICEISGFYHSSGMLRCEVGNWLPRFCDSISVPSSWTAWPSKMGMTNCPKTPITNYQPAVHNISESEDLNKVYQHFQILVKIIQKQQTFAMYNGKTVLSVRHEFRLWKQLII